MTHTLSTTLLYWRSCPLWAASLLLLISVIIFGGPVACLAHCMLLDAAQHQPRLTALGHVHHAHDAHGSHSTAPSCPSAGAHSPHSEHAEPSALTVAIMLPLLLMPLLLTTSFRRLRATMRRASLLFAPPDRPPRLAHS